MPSTVINRNNPSFLEQWKHLSYSSKATPAPSLALHPPDAALHLLGPITANLTLQGAETAGWPMGCPYGVQERVSSKGEVLLVTLNTALYHYLSLLPESSFQVHSGPNMGWGAPWTPEWDPTLLKSRRKGSYRRLDMLQCLKIGELSVEKGPKLFLVC